MRASDRLRRLCIAGLAACWALGGIAAALAQTDADPQARLRAALREATVRVRQLEDENATLQAKQAELERGNLAATQKAAQAEKGLQALRGQSTAAQTALQRSADEQKESLAKWEAAYKEAADTAKARDADAKRMEAALVALREQNRLAEEKNAKLYKLGQELLDLYDQKKILDVVGVGEPVTKLKRVEYENVIQDYEDRLRGSRITHPAPQ
jgi:colicin import membrane protein